MNRNTLVQEILSLKIVTIEGIQKIGTLNDSDTKVEFSGVIVTGGFNASVRAFIKAKHIGNIAPETFGGTCGWSSRSLTNDEAEIAELIAIKASNSINNAIKLAQANSIV